jgi:hypothetical protein
VTSRAAFLAWHPTLLAVAVAEPDRAPDVRAVVESFNSGWRSEAACQGEESLFLSDVNLGFPKHAGSTVVTLALLICAGCPVRRECLVEALTEIAFDLDPGSHDSNRPKTTIHVDGVWGRTTTVDRRSVSGLSRDKALARLERTFPARLQRHALAFRRKVLANANPYRQRARERRVLKLLEERRLTVTPRCEGCGEKLPTLARSDARYCSVRSRVAAHRGRAA